MRSIAHLNALRAFEASARHQSFSLAAQELNVTPAAVGQLVRTLEDWLGSPLFVRSTSGRARLVTTEVAEQALPDIRAGLERLAVGLERLRSGSAGGVLTVTVSPAFAAKWLLPRIERFQAAWPETDLRLDTSLKPVDFVGQRINNSAAVLQAAVDGQGVALARSVMAHDDLAAGRLVRLFPQVRLESALAYYVVYRPECIAQPKVAAFRDWLLREAHGPA